jgi:Protein of unknown function (DUF664)
MLTSKTPARPLPNAICGAWSHWSEMSLRWALIHMIGEYAGHTGQADLIRERIDGKAGWW